VFGMGTGGALLISSPEAASLVLCPSSFVNGQDEDRRGQAGISIGSGKSCSLHAPVEPSLYGLGGSINPTCPPTILTMDH
jgi:hypothetical protein